MIRLNKLPATPYLARTNGGLREMEEKDVKQVLTLYTQYMERFGMVPVLSPEEVAHHFLSGKGKGEKQGRQGPWQGRREGQVVWSYVIEVT